MSAPPVSAPADDINSPITNLIEQVAESDAAEHFAYDLSDPISRSPAKLHTESKEPAVIIVDNILKTLEEILDVLRESTTEDGYLRRYFIEECNARPRDPSDDSVSLRRKVLDLCPKGHQYHARSLNRLAGDLYTRFRQSGNTEDINEAIDLSREALSACSPDGERSYFLAVLSYALKLRFQHLRNPDDIEESITLIREALSLRPPGHPGRWGSLINYSRALKARYDQYANPADLEGAKELERAAKDLRSINPGSPTSSNWHRSVYLDLGRSPVSDTPISEVRQQQRLDVESLLNDYQMRPRDRNVVFFGESGSGKSSVVNAITQSQSAQTSSGATGCTFRCERHEVDISGRKFVLFDTVGLNEGNEGTVPGVEAEKSLKNLMRKLMSPGSDGISLLVYCVRGARSARALVKNYSLVYSVTQQKNIPIVVVVTGLEDYEPTMESWWEKNGQRFHNNDMHVEDHACVTTLPEDSHLSDDLARRIRDSCTILRDLILNNYSEWTPVESWLQLFLAEVRKRFSSQLNVKGSPLHTPSISCI